MGIFTWLEPRMKTRSMVKSEQWSTSRKLHSKFHPSYYISHTRPAVQISSLYRKSCRFSRHPSQYPAPLSPGSVRTRAERRTVSRYCSHTTALPLLQPASQHCHSRLIRHHRDWNLLQADITSPARPSRDQTEALIGVTMIDSGSRSMSPPGTCWLVLDWPRHGCVTSRC